MKKVLGALIAGLTLTFNSAYITNVEMVREEQMNSNVLFQEYKMDTSYIANDQKVTRNVYTYTLTKSEDVHLATWTYASKEGYSLRSLLDIARNYEENHPGWIVLGGVNAEGYYEGELTNAFVQDGDVIRKDVSAEVFKELIGFKKDGSHVIKQIPTASAYPALKVNDHSYDITRINELPENGGISLLTKDLAKTLNISQYTVIEADYTMYRKSSKFPGGTLSGNNLGIFVKGTSKGIANIAEISKVDNGKFYLVTNNQTVVSEFEKNPVTQVKCQYDYTDEFKDVESMVGYMYKYVENGEVIPASYVDTNDHGDQVIYDCAYYKTTSKERCGIGFTDDGKIVLLTTNTGKGGPTQYEVGQMFKSFGCNNAYQFDGGGSVTFIKRNEQGELEMLNTPGDGHIRSIMSGLFIVAKDPGYAQSVVDSTSSSITFNLDTTEYASQITNASITYNGTTFKDENGQITVTNLDPNTEYVFDITYTADGKTWTTEVKGQTKKYKPGVYFTPTSKGFDVSINENDKTLALTKVTIKVDDKTYEVEDLKELIINDLSKGYTYEVSYTYTYENKNTNKEYTETSEVQMLSTLSYSKPEVTEFKLERYTKNRIMIRYNIADEDDLVTKYYLDVNGKTYELTTKNGVYAISDVNTETTNYEIKLVVEYTLENRPQRMESQTVKIETEHVHDWIPATTEKPKTCRTCGATEGDPLPKKEEPKGGCTKTNVVQIITAISLVSLSVYLLKKKQF